MLDIIVGEKAAWPSGVGRRLEISGAPNDSFLSDPLKRYFRLSGVPLKLCRFISGRAIIFLSVQSF